MEPVGKVATHYNIQEMAKGLRIHASRDLALWERLLPTCLAAAIAVAVSVNFLGAWWSLGLSSLAAALTFMLFRSQNAQLLATNVEFVTTGDLGRRAKTPRIVFTADVRQLRFGSVGPLGSGYDGLYAETTRREICILPFLDFQQTAEVIKAVEKKFPGLAQLWLESNGSLKSGIPRTG